MKRGAQLHTRTPTANQRARRVVEFGRGRRVLKRGAKVYPSGTPSRRTSYFFNGLTEEIRKISVAGAHADSSFGITVKDDSTSVFWYAAGSDVVSDYDDPDRRSYVRELDGVSGTSAFLLGDQSGTGSNPEDTPWNSTQRVLSTWYRGGWTSFDVFITASSGEKYVRYASGTGTNGVDGSGNVTIYLGTFASATQWKKFERNIEKDFETYSGGPSWTNTDGLRIDTDNTVSGDILYLDDLLLTNAMTIEHNTLGGGGIGQILRQRTIDTSTYAATDRWFHYDQVGSVVLETDSTGASAQSHDQDAFGNTLASWITGLIGGDRAGRHHNTKEFDSDIGLVYMYQRWYSPELGIFISSAPYPPMMEHRYSFAGQNPVSGFDPDGRMVISYPIGYNHNYDIILFNSGDVNYPVYLSAIRFRPERMANGGETIIVTSQDQLERALGDIPGGSKINIFGHGNADSGVAIGYLQSKADKGIGTNWVDPLQFPSSLSKHRDSSVHIYTCGFFGNGIVTASQWSDALGGAIVTGYQGTVRYNGLSGVSGSGNGIWLDGSNGGYY